MIDQPCFAYNLWNIDLFDIFSKLCFKYSTPTILQVSEKIAKTMDLRIFTGQVTVLKETLPEYIFLNLDHARDIEMVKECVDLGWDMVMYDGSNLSLEENIRNTREIVEYAHKQQTIVEGEIDPIHGVGSTENVVTPQKTDIKMAKEFIETTGVDYFAIALGTFHGYSPDKSIEIDYNLLDRASRELDVDMVLHGGSGLSVDTYRKCFSMKIKKINISTEVKQVYKHAIIDATYKEGFDMRFLNQLILEKMEDLFKEKKQVFEGLT